ncbi:aspartate/glutamate racemase family protein [Microvirga sp. VF16]|uniref:maleate cis-trans isomerase family protein n=1 Tax=Microvirga sp. VF16 TaxID=2807101 RepID=UPI00193D6FF4|nr:aspartate/glutamate racemase family protein [Microvirga sp. VF16]QRM33152.1 aspartate/glutamate racemase family protein [Microvirga sp. VF16]
MTIGTTMPEIRQVPVPGGKMEDNYGEKVRIGLIALCDDVAVDRDFARMVPDDRVALVTSRLFLEQPNSQRTFLNMADRIPDTVRLLCPLLRLDSVVFGCTSGTSFIGEARVTELVHSARPSVNVTNPGSGAIAALSALGAKRVSVITPYTIANTANVVRMLAEGGIESVQVSCFGFDTDMDIGSVPREAYLEVARNTDHQDAQAIFISCTATKALDAIEDIEAAAGLPCVTSNQAAFWHAMRLAGWNESILGFGRLMRDCW